LLVTICGVGLLATFVLPFPQHLQQEERLSGCLGRLAQIGAASLAYAAEDPRQQLVPIHAAEVTPLHAYDWLGTSWGWRTAATHVFGGQTPTTAFPIDGDVELTTMLDEHYGPDPNPWGAATRPLNPLVASGGGSLQTFHCPADAGYPAAAAGWESPDIPAPAAGISCFEMLGNSYKINCCGAVYFDIPSLVNALMNSGTSGHGPELILEPARTVMYSDPLFYGIARQLAGSYPVDPLVGWHGFLMADNAVYCDGSARLTQVGTLYQFGAQELQDMGYWRGYGSEGMFLRRGSTWQMDCYPAPGALIKTYDYSGGCFFDPLSLSQHGWPFDRFSENENPFASESGRGRIPAARVAPATVQYKLLSQ
jgi:hypothetical protein